jgi:hypothetical protein
MVKPAPRKSGLGVRHFLEYDVPGCLIDAG